MNLNFNHFEAPNLNSRLFLLLGGQGCRGASPILPGPPPPPPPGYNRFPGPSTNRPPPGPPGHFMRFGQEMRGVGMPFNMNGYRYESVPRGPAPPPPPRPTFVPTPGGQGPFPNEPPPNVAAPQFAEAHPPTAGASGSSEPPNQASQPQSDNLSKRLSKNHELLLEKLQTRFSLSAEDANKYM